MIISMLIGSAFIFWAWFRFQQNRNNTNVLTRVAEDQFIIGDGFYRKHHNRFWLIRKVLGSRFEYLNPLKITMDLDPNNIPKQYRHLGSPIKSVVHRKLTKLRNIG
ncbi:hypothetical protein LCGC14_1200850 [marine sediment metagenome]|uniref:Uncharacterized protein n=1 Tax=marine sediment metagenome TaxID=412755 RepID=A0A0F9LGX0_9ZZZZ